MGLATTAVHFIWAVVLVGAGGAFGVALWDNLEDLQDAQASRLERDARRVAADARIVNVVYNAGTSTVRVQMVNNGTVPLDPWKMNFVFTGSARPILSVQTAGVSGSSVWEPKAHSNITVSSKWEPQRVAATDEFGHTYVWKNTKKPVFTEIMITPGPANVQATKTQQFTAQGYDQFGNPWPATFSWSEDLSGSSIGGSSGLFSAGTTLTCGLVTATSGSLSNTSSTCVVKLQLRVDWIKTYKGSNEQYTFAKGEKVTTKMHIVAALDGADAPNNIKVWMVTKDPNGVQKSNNSDKTDNAGVAKTDYTIPGAGPAGTWTVEMTGLDEAYVWYRPELSTETVQPYTVT